MQVSKETITPKKAMEWLKRNIHNRPLSQHHVRKLASAMKAGAWRMNGDTIRFNANGDLADGQHRLNACILSGLPFEAYVVRGLTVEAFDTIDNGGMPRSAGHVLCRRGEKHYFMLASAVGIAHQFQHELPLESGGAMRIDEVVAYLEANPSLRDCCEFASVNRSDGIIPPSLVAGLLFHFRQVDESKADAFWKSVLTGEQLTKSMIEYKFRDRLIQSKLSKTEKLRRTPIAAFAVKSFNSKITGVELKVLKWTSEEEFPKLVKKKK
jgi:hypothetical protein